MARKLRVDNLFTPCPEAIGDELYPNGIFVFNITRMLEHIHGHPEEYPLENIAVNEFCKEFSSINETHMDSVEISEPVILAEISPGRYNLIDGNHRMEKARRIGMESIMAYRLNAEQHMRFLTSRKSYEAYIEYWNGKLE